MDFRSNGMHFLCRCLLKELVDMHAVHSDFPMVLRIVDVNIYFFSFFFFTTIWFAVWLTKTILLNEPRHAKTNKMAVRPAKTQISLGIRQV